MSLPVNSTPHPLPPPTSSQGSEAKAECAVSFGGRRFRVSVRTKENTSISQETLEKITEKVAEILQKKELLTSTSPAPLQCRITRRGISIPTRQLITHRDDNAQKDTQKDYDDILNLLRGSSSLLGIENGGGTPADPPTEGPNEEEVTTDVCEVVQPENIATSPPERRDTSPLDAQLPSKVDPREFLPEPKTLDGNVKPPLSREQVLTSVFLGNEEESQQLRPLALSMCDEFNQEHPDDREVLRDSSDNRATSPPKPEEETRRPAQPQSGNSRLRPNPSSASGFPPTGPAPRIFSSAHLPHPFLPSFHPFPNQPPTSKPPPSSPPPPSPPSRSKPVANPYHPSGSFGWDGDASNFAEGFRGGPPIPDHPNHT